MCSCRTRAVRWKARLRPWAASKAERSGRRALARVRRPQRVHRLPQLRRLLQLGLRAEVALAPGPGSANDCRDHGGHGGVHGLAGSAAARAPPRQPGPRAEVHLVRVASPARSAAPRTRAVGFRLRRVWDLETSAATAQDCPALAFPVAVCAAYRGRASICACCTCNTPA